jgi:hypothetical protein
MDPIALIREKLAAFPGVEINEVSDGIRIEAPNEGGFDITIERFGDQWRVSAGEVGVDRWYEKAEAVLHDVAFLLSEEAALCEWYRNGEFAAASYGSVGEHTSLAAGTFDDPASARTVKVYRNRLQPRPDFTS